MCTLIDLLSDQLKVPEEIDGLLNALTNTHTGHRILRVMNRSNVARFLDFLKKFEKKAMFFSKMIDVFELAASIVSSSEIDRGEDKQELTMFDTLDEAIYCIHSLPSSTIIEDLLIKSPEQGRMRFLNILWNLDSAITDAFIFKKIGFIYRLKDMVQEEELVQRIKRCFSFDILTDSAEIQRAFMRNEALIVENQKKIQTYSSVLISAKQAKTIQTLWNVISIHELKAEWVTYFRSIWALLLEHWDPREHILEAITIRDLFKEIRNRDNNQCVLCHKKDDLHVHHILKKSTHIKYIASPENLITLCEDCHLNKAHPNNTHFIDFDLAQKLLYISFINSFNYSISQETQKILINKLQKYLKIIL